MNKIMNDIAEDIERMAFFAKNGINPEDVNDICSAVYDRLLARGILQAEPQP